MTIIIINPNSTRSMTDAMVETAQRAAPDLTFEGWTSQNAPPAIQGREDGLAATPMLLELAEKAARDGVGGIVIGCFDDTALAEAARQKPCPVIGIGQAAYYACALRQRRFSVVTTLSVSVPVIEANIQHLGLAGHLGRVRASGVPVLDLDTAPSSAEALVMRETRAAVQADGIDAVILGCAGMVHLIDAVGASVPVPVVDPVAEAARAMMWLTA